jgi:hypothetical protein
VPHHRTQRSETKQPARNLKLISPFGASPRLALLAPIAQWDCPQGRAGGRSGHSGTAAGLFDGDTGYPQLQCHGVGVPHADAASFSIIRSPIARTSYSRRTLVATPQSWLRPSRNVPNLHMPRACYTSISGIRQITFRAVLGRTPPNFAEALASLVTICEREKREKKGIQLS